MAVTFINRYEAFVLVTLLKAMRIHAPLLVQFVRTPVSAMIGVEVAFMSPLHILEIRYNLLHMTYLQHNMRVLQMTTTSTSTVVEYLYFILKQEALEPKRLSPSLI